MLSFMTHLGNAHQNCNEQSGRQTFRPRTMAQFVCNLTEKTPVLVNAALTYLKPRLATFWHCAKAELVPPTPAEISTAIWSLKKITSSAQTGSFKQLTVKEALLIGLLATEVWMWFYVGEIIGKHGIIGYDV
ncbi:ATP synthase subunit g, mitochondrial-like [Hippopotamus amphibius kiboko]|uniref:ATP synthase subunit g, mitochondrial-like n=1 Tax=Hippopotamus amphibius kiboko TaxID=575201 RepID=UPI0025990579|nr:ATP synthase subunit g, mitochondrial-like [Hippopotamus amphibius kiboko]